MSGRGGRPKSEIWEHVIELGENRVECRYCEFEFAKSANRIKAHLFHTQHKGIRPCPNFPHSNQTRLNTEINSNDVVNNLINSQGRERTIHQQEVNNEIEQHGTMHVGPFSVSKPFFVSKLNEFDSQLIHYVFNTPLSDEKIFSSSYSYLKRSEFTTLKPAGLLYSSVIDIFADYLTDIEPKSENTISNWYLPLMFSIFIPVHREQHYYLYVIHWKESQEVQILDSLPGHINKEVCDLTTKKLLLALDGLFEEELRGKRWAFKNFSVTKSEDILSQPIKSNDCGIFVINNMQQNANYKNPSFQYHSDEERLDLALKLLKSDQNMERERVYGVVKQQYAHDKDHDQESWDLPGTKRKRVDDTCKEISKDVGRGAYAELDDSHTTFRNNVGMEKGHTRGYPIPTTNLVGQEFPTYKDQIWEWLMEDEVSVIGVWGIGGVGKTALVTHIHNMVLEEDEAADYDHVIWVTVSQKYSIRQLQRVIGRSINLDISNECEEKRISGILLHKFKQMKKCVVILDDVWDYVCLEEVGLPDLDDHPGIKLILTSRSWEVCQSMNCGDTMIELKRLSYWDAMDLFKKTLRGYERLPKKVKDLAWPIVNQCLGLPLAIVTIARSMKGKQDLREWQHIYGRLRNLKSGQYDEVMDKSVFPVLRSSYDRLTDTKLQEFFLYCAILFSEFGGGDEEDMIPRIFGEKLIDEKKSLIEQFKECHILLVKLKNKSLFLQGFGYGMHSLVRVMAIRILKEKHKILECIDERLREIPDEHWTEDLEKVFLVNNNISEISEGISPRCSKLSTLILKGNRNLKWIGDEFFKNMPALRDVPSLANLQRLVWLDLSYTAITEAPQGLELLINLRYLNLLGTQELKMSTTSVIPKLTKLQYLRLNCIAESMDVRAQDLQGLKELEIIFVNFCDIQEFNSYMTSRLPDSGLKHYCFNLGKAKEDLDLEEELEEEYSGLFLKEDSIKKVRLVGLELGNMSVEIPADIKKLDIWGCDHCSEVPLCNILLCHNKCRIEECHIFKCHNLEFLCCLSPSCKFCSSVQFIESLRLIGLNELRFLCMDNHRGRVAALPPISPFSHLTSLTIESCDRMKKVVMPDMSAQLQNLERLVVERCESVEEIFSIASGEDDAQHDFHLPKLKFVWLGGLPQLNFVCKGTILCDSSLSLTIRMCPKLKRPLQTDQMMPNGCSLYDSNVTGPYLIPDKNSASSFTFTWITILIPLQLLIQPNNAGPDCVMLCFPGFPCRCVDAGSCGGGICSSSSVVMPCCSTASPREHIARNKRNPHTQPISRRKTHQITHTHHIINTLSRPQVQIPRRVLHRLRNIPSDVVSERLPTILHLLPNTTRFVRDCIFGLPNRTRNRFADLPRFLRRLLRFPHRSRDPVLAFPALADVWENRRRLFDFVLGVADDAARKIAGAAAGGLLVVIVRLQLVGSDGDFGVVGAVLVVFDDDDSVALFDDGFVSVVTGGRRREDASCGE
ncbi:putative disease resistance protein [Senna tora]|uniref:Putative disease resistance protein n=1 Tax=Senna tora TaxID=362788 RepID=A0A834X1C6_9FABA|nr:putative disease resistance protein [Senna tora]